MKHLLSIILVGGFLLGLACRSDADATVVGTGRADATLANAREQALTDAMRDAVRRGAGVDLLSTTKVTDFALDYDRVFASAFGYVKEYSVISQEVDNGGFYTVRIKAVVGPGQPGRDDVLALKTIVAQKGSPRVLIETGGDITGTFQSPKIVEGVLKELALKTQMQIVNAKSLKRARGRRARRDALVGDVQSAKMRDAGILGDCDFLIEADVQGNYAGKETVYDIPTHKVALGAELSASWPDTSETIAQVSIPSTSVNSQMASPQQAIRESLQRLLMGRLPVSRQKNALTLFRRIMAAWITELDLGAKVQLEFKNLDKTSLDRLVKALKETRGIGSVSVREFDSRAFSIIEVESRLDANALKDVIGRETGGMYEIDRFSKNFLQFLPTGKSYRPPKKKRDYPSIEGVAPGAQLQPSGNAGWGAATAGGPQVTQTVTAADRGTTPASSKAEVAGEQVGDDSGDASTGTSDQTASDDSSDAPEENNAEAIVPAVAEDVAASDEPSSGSGGNGMSWWFVIVGAAILLFLFLVAVVVAVVAVVIVKKSGSKRNGTPPADGDNAKTVVQ